MFFIFYLFLTLVALAVAVLLLAAVISGIGIIGVVVYMVIKKAARDRARDAAQANDRAQLK